MSFGPWLGRCRNAQLVHLSGARHALLLGDGDGRFLARLLAANPTLTADVVDSSQAMLRLLDRRIRRCGPQARHRIRLHHADALRVEAHRKLRSDCFSLLPRLLFPPAAGATLCRRSSPCSPRRAMGHLGVRHSPECLSRPISRAGSSVFSIERSVCLPGFPFARLPDYATSLLRRGLAPSHDRRYLAGLLCSQIWTLTEEHPIAKML